MFLYLLSGWASIGIVIFIVSFFSVYLEIAGAILFLGCTVATVQQLWVLLNARRRVLLRKKVNLFWGLVQLIAWDPVEGVLVLRNKEVAFSDDNLQDAAGGIRFLYPILGEELALRVPLEVQTLAFEDERVMTREYLSVTIRGTMKWRIADIRKFYLFVSRELRSTSNEGNRESVSPSTRPTVSGDDDAETAIRQLLRAAIAWMQVLVEEETRLVVSRSRSGLLIADRLAKDFFPQDERTQHDGVAASSLTQATGGQQWGGAAEGLARAIHNTVAARLEGYGIAVDDVSLQEIKLPPAVIEECIRACKAYYIPISAQRESTEIGAKLQAQVNVIGREAVATKEVVGAAPAFAIADFLTMFLQKQLRHPDKGGDGTLAGIAASMGALGGPGAVSSGAPGAITSQESPK